MALSHEALTTLAQAKQSLGIATADEDALLESYIEAASAACETFCRRRFARAEGVVDTFETEDAANRFLLLRRPPVESVASVRLDGVPLVEGTDWERYGTPEFGAIRLLMATTGRFEVTYTGGFVTQGQAEASGGTLTRNLPRDVELAVVLAVTTLYRGANRDPNVTRENLLSAGQAFSNGWFVLSPAAQALLHPWRLEP